MQTPRNSFVIRLIRNVNRDLENYTEGKVILSRKFSLINQGSLGHCLYTGSKYRSFSISPLVDLYVRCFEQPGAGAASTAAAAAAEALAQVGGVVVVVWIHWHQYLRPN